MEYLAFLFIRTTIRAALERQGALLLTNDEFCLINLPAPSPLMFSPTGFCYAALSTHLKEKTCQDLFLCQYSSSLTVSLSQDT